MLFCIVTFNLRLHFNKLLTYLLTYLPKILISEYALISPHEPMNYGLFSPKTTCYRQRKFLSSRCGTFVPWNFRSLQLSLLGSLLPGTLAATNVYSRSEGLDYMYGTFAVTAKLARTVLSELVTQYTIIRCVKVSNEMDPLSVHAYSLLQTVTVNEH